MLKLNHITKRFGTFTAVNDLSIEIAPGQFYGFLGPNGAGKTTTIKMITGLFAPTAGTITINGFDIQKQPIEAKQGTGYIPDQPVLYEKLTGRECLYFTAGLYKVKHDAATESIRQLAEYFEIGSWLDRRTEHYSQGMRQRIVIASALVHDPKVLVIDEPMIGLDPKSAFLVKKMLTAKQKEGAAILMSTHSLHIVEELCNRIGIIKDGSLIFEDSLDGLPAFKQKYDGKFESAFLEIIQAAE